MAWNLKRHKWGFKGLSMNDVTGREVSPWSKILWRQYLFCTKKHGGERSKDIKNSVTSFMDSPLSQSDMDDGNMLHFKWKVKFSLSLSIWKLPTLWRWTLSTLSVKDVVWRGTATDEIEWSWGEGSSTKVKVRKQRRLWRLFKKCQTLLFVMLLIAF